MIAQKNGERVLIFSSREICYSSSNFFANQIGEAFEELGYMADICEFSKEDDFDALLEPLTEQQYRVILDFNSLLPRMVMEDGSYYLDHLNGPFFDYILDHPLFHYNGLMTGAKNFCVIVLDEAQQRYVQQYYTSAREVFMLPLAATEAFSRKKTQKADHILFMGTYDAPEAVYELVEASPEPLKTVMKHLIERRLAEPLLPMEEAFMQYLGKNGIELKKGEFALYMNAMYPVDAYIRDYFRKVSLDKLVFAGIPVKVIGEGWEKYKSPIEKLFTREPSVTFSLSFEKIAQEEVLLNVSPIFNRGMHDRVPAGMANRTAVLTDENPYLKKTLVRGENISFFSLERLETLAQQAELLLTDEALRRSIQERGYEEFAKKHTWRHRAEQILYWADELQR